MELVFDHVAQIVPDIAQAVAFTTELVPNAVVLYQDASWAFVEAGGVKLAFVLRDQHPHHLAWRVSAPELENLATRYDKPIAAHRDGTRSFYVDGPGGMSAEIITFDGSRWEATTQEKNP
jgi:hypothetical protein